jgi:hypothetical protein
MKYLKSINEDLTGWVNVKIDKEVFFRVQRFISAINTDYGVEAFDAKLKYIANPTKPKIGSVNEKIQKQMSGVMLMHYLNELKNNFNGSSAGFLLESFLGGLIGGIVVDDNGPIDVKSTDGQSYQIKFFNWDNTSHISINSSLTCDYYIIALKKGDDIFVWRLNQAGSSPDRLLSTYLTKPIEKEPVKKEVILTKAGKPKKEKKEKPVVWITKLKKRLDLAIKIDVSSKNIDSKIDLMADGLKQDLNSIWTEISDLQFNIEGIVTGVDKNHHSLNDNEYEALHKAAKANLTKLEEQLTSLKGNMGNR